MTQTAFALDDPALVRAVRNGDTEAFDTLFRRHYGPVQRMCVRQMGSEIAGDEIAQVAFMRVYERVRLGLTGVAGGREARFGPWVKSIALRLCLEAGRS